MMNGEEFANLKREANRVAANGQSGRAAWGDTGSSIPSDAAVFNDAVELNSVNNGLSTDWQDLIYHNGSQLNNQLSVSGGTEKTSVLVAFSNFKEEGIMDGTDFGRYSGRINADHEISKVFKVGISAIVSNATQNFGSGSLLELDAGDEGRLARLIGAQLVVVDAAAPGLRHDIVGLFGETLAHEFQHSLGVPIGVMQGQRHGFLADSARHVAAEAGIVSSLNAGAIRVTAGLCARRPVTCNRGILLASAGPAMEKPLDPSTCPAAARPPASGANRGADGPDLHRRPARTDRDRYP